MWPRLQKEKKKTQFACLQNEGKDHLVQAVSGQAEGTQPCRQPEKAALE